MIEPETADQGKETLTVDELSLLFGLEFSEDCTARFRLADRTDWLSGIGRVTVDSKGYLLCELVALEKSNPDYTLKELCVAFHSVPKGVEGEVTTVGGPTNPCAEFVIETNLGTFHSVGPCGYTKDLRLTQAKVVDGKQVEPTETVGMDLQTYEWEYETECRDKPGFWSALLTGLPGLRIWNPSKDGPFVLKDSEHAWIEFAFQGRTYWLISVPPDTSGLPRHSALLVGELPSDAVELTRLAEQVELPAILDALSLANGGYVGCLTLDVHSESTDLMRRIPGKVFPLATADPQSTIRLDNPKLLEQFLSVVAENYSASDYPVHFAVRQFLTLGSSSLKLEELVYHACQGLESLLIGVKVGGLDHGAEMPAQVLDDIESGIDSLRALFRLDETPSPKYFEDADKWFGLITRARKPQPGFQQKLLVLLEHTGLDDAGAARYAFARLPGLQGQDWLRIVTGRRNDISHGRSFDVRPGDGLEELDCLIVHLKDLLLRLLLIQLGYLGPYYSPLLLYREAPDPNWVNESTLDSALQELYAAITDHRNYKPTFGLRVSIN